MTELLTIAFRLQIHESMCYVCFYFEKSVHLGCSRKEQKSFRQIFGAAEEILGLAARFPSTSPEPRSGRKRHRELLLAICFLRKNKI